MPAWTLNVVVSPTEEEVLAGIAILVAGLLLSLAAYLEAPRARLTRRRWVAGLLALAILGFVLTALGIFMAQAIVFLVSLLLYSQARPRWKESLN